MSRTTHHRGQKHNKYGFDFWTRRPGNKGGGGHGAYAKARTHSMERAEEARIIHDEVQNLEYHEVE